MLVDKASWYGYAITVVDEAIVQPGDELRCTMALIARSDAVRQPKLAGTAVERAFCAFAYMTGLCPGDTGGRMAG